MRMSDLAVLNLTFSFAEGLLHCGSELWLTPLVSGVPQKVQSPCQLSCYGTRSGGAIDYVMHVLGHGGVEATPGTAWSSSEMTRKVCLVFRKPRETV